LGLALLGKTCIGRIKAVSKKSGYVNFYHSPMSQVGLQGTVTVTLVVHHNEYISVVRDAV